MIRSMTGIGRGERQVGGTLVVVDVKSVNHRFLDLKVKLPSEAVSLEPDLRRLVSGRLERGRVDLAVTLQRENSCPEVRVNHPLLKRYVKAARAIRKETGVEGEITLEALLHLPGAVRVEYQQGELSRAESTAIREAVGDAITALLGMREREGEALGRDLRKRLGTIRRRAAVIQRRAGGLEKRITTRLRDRVRKLAEGVDADPARLAQEIAYLADRADVAEELVRLDAHLDAMLELADRKAGAAGKQLDFLTQELHRETNTIHSTSGDLPVSRAALEIKSEVEKIREQVQNIE
jgi:uncharacterized protein (TIGR00255 family)